MIRALISVCTAGALLTVLPATAQDTNISNARAKREDGKCVSPDRWTRGNGPVVIRGGGTIELELFGPFMDMSDSASLTGVSGGSAKLREGRNGAHNFVTGCSNNGSAVVGLTLPDVAGATSANLRVGNETLPLRLLPYRPPRDFTWAPDNAATGEEETSAERQQRYDLYVAGQQRDQRQCMRDNPEGETYAAQCRQLYPIMPIDHVIPDENAQRNLLLTRCGGPHGLRAVVSGAGNHTLTLTLPVDRAALGRCATLPLAANMTFPDSGVPAHFTVGSPPTVRFSRGGNGPQLLPASGIPGYNYGYRIGRADLETLVGRYEQTLNWTPMGGNASLRLILRSEPDYGVKAANPPFVHQGVGRLGSTIDIAVQPAQPTETGQVFEWNASGSPQGVSASTCLQAVSGTVTPPAGQARFTVPLTVKEEPRCYGKTYTVAIGPRGLSDNAIFGRSTTFTIHAPAQVRNPGNLIDDRVKIQGPGPLIRP